MRELIIILCLMGNVACALYCLNNLRKIKKLRLESKVISEKLDLFDLVDKLHKVGNLLKKDLTHLEKSALEMEAIDLNARIRLAVKDLKPNELYQHIG